MSGLRKKVNSRRNRLASHSVSCIPKVLSNDPFEYTTNLFQNSIARSFLLEKISVIDPYILPIDLDNLASLFGGSSDINIEIISKFDSNYNDEEKKDRKIKINERKKYLIENGLFGTIELIHSKESMHDRYYVYWSNKTIIKLFNIGGSVGQRFEDYIGIIEISDKFMLYNVADYYDKLVSNKINFL